ncbi:MAG: DUF2007 domain-containing protein [Candidatus Eisenbacteria bacterium]
MDETQEPVMVTVLETHDPLLTPVVKSLLEAEGIPCVVLNEFTQDLLGSRLVLGYNPVLGPMRVQVESANEEAARELIAHHLSAAESEALEQEESPQS